MTAPDTFDIAIVGTGIHGMHMYVRLSGEPFFLTARIVSIDPAEDALAQWKRRARNCSMQYLRSPGSHGIHPQFNAIRLFAREFPVESPFIPPYHRPALALFNAHCAQEISRAPIKRHHVTGRVHEVYRGNKHVELSIIDNGGTKRTIRAGAAIFALGPPAPLIPPAFTAASRSAVHHVYDHTFDPGDIPTHSRVAIVGGGIGGTHLALNLSRKSKILDIWNRDPFVPSQYDSDPCFIGPRCGEPFRSIGSYHRRRATIARSRRIGSVPPDLLTSLWNHIDRGSVSLLNTAVSRVVEKPSGIVLAGEGSSGTVMREYDRVILATGFADGPPEPDLITGTASRLNLPVDDQGFPLLRPDLSWTGDTEGSPPMYCMGALADLEIGPPARNIIGAHLAGRKIVPSLQRHLEISRS